MKINYKVLREGAKPPVRASDGAGAYDLSVMINLNMSYYGDKNYVGGYGTGIALDIPDNYVGLIIERSSLHDNGFNLANTVGVIDSDYRGEIVIKLKSKREKLAGGRVAQLLVVKAEELEFEEVNKLTKTQRGDAGWGSTGK